MAGQTIEIQQLEGREKPQWHWKGHGFHCLQDGRSSTKAPVHVGGFISPDGSTLRLRPCFYSRSVDVTKSQCMTMNSWMALPATLILRTIVLVVEQENNLNI